MRRTLIAMSIFILAPLPAMAAQDVIIDHTPIAATALSDLTLAPNHGQTVIFPASVHMLGVKLADASARNPAGPPIYIVSNPSDRTNFLVVGTRAGSVNLTATDAGGKEITVHVTVTAP